MTIKCIFPSYWIIKKCEREGGSESLYRRGCESAPRRNGRYFCELVFDNKLSGGETARCRSVRQNQGKNQFLQVCIPLGTTFVRGFREFLTSNYSASGIRTKRSYCFLIRRCPFRDSKDAFLPKIAAGFLGVNFFASQKREKTLLQQFIQVSACVNYRDNNRIKMFERVILSENLNTFIYTQFTFKHKEWVCNNVCNSLETFRHRPHNRLRFWIGNIFLSEVFAKYYSWSSILRVINRKLYFAKSFHRNVEWRCKSLLFLQVLFSTCFPLRITLCNSSSSLFALVIIFCAREKEKSRSAFDDNWRHLKRHWNRISLLFPLPYRAFNNRTTSRKARIIAFFVWLLKN